MEPVQEEVVDSFAAVWPQCDGMVLRKLNIRR